MASGAKNREIVIFISTVLYDVKRVLAKKSMKLTTEFFSIKALAFVDTDQHQIDQIII